MRCLVLVCVAGLLVGCGRNDGPLLSHGKPVGYWVEALQNADPSVRAKAVTALGHVGAADPAALAGLIAGVKDRDRNVRSQAVLALLNIGPAAREALPVLEEAQKDRDATIRNYAGKAVERIRGGQ